MLPVVLLLSSCVFDEREWILVNKCLPDTYDRMESMIYSCRGSGLSLSSCIRDAKSLYCEDMYIKNPNWKDTP